MNGEYSIEIEAPREQVFAFLDDDANMKVIVPNLADFGTIEDKPEKVGSTFWHVYEEKGRKMKMTGVVTEYRAPERMAIQMDGPVFGLQIRYTLDELGPTSTRLTQFSDARMKHVFKIFGLLFGKKMQAEGERVQKETFARIKELVEAQHSAAEPRSGE